MTKEQFVLLFAGIKKQGLIKTLRAGNTGVGHTLEQLLGLTENNDALPDLGFAELKAHRQGVSSLITLFTYDRGAWIGDKKSLIQGFGTPDPLTPNRTNLYFTMKNEGVTSTGLQLYGVDESVSLYAPKIEDDKVVDEVVAEWELDDLAAVFNKKIPALVIVSAHCQMQLGVEYFQYTKAVLYHTTTKDLLRQNLLGGNLMLDLRMHAAMHNTTMKVRNHGTAFRMREDKLSELFSVAEQLG